MIVRGDDVPVRTGEMWRGGEQPTAGRTNREFGRNAAINNDDDNRSGHRVRPLCLRTRAPKVPPGVKAAIFDCI